MPCGDPHHYSNINSDKINLIIGTLKKNGASVQGENPWMVDTNNFGIKLVGTWDAASERLSVEVTDKSFFVPCNKIWEQLDPMIQKISQSDIA